MNSPALRIQGDAGYDTMQPNIPLLDKYCSNCTVYPARAWLCFVAVELSSCVHPWFLALRLSSFLPCLQLCTALYAQKLSKCTARPQWDWAPLRIGSKRSNHMNSDVNTLLGLNPGWVNIIPCFYSGVGWEDGAEAENIVLSIRLLASKHGCETAFNDPDTSFNCHFLCKPR